MERTRWEGPEALAPGKHTLVFDFKYDGPGFGKGGTGVLSVDGKEVANKKMAHTVPFLLSFDETFDVGVDTRTGVDDNDYQVPFKFTGNVKQADGQTRPAEDDGGGRGRAPKTNTGRQESRPVIVASVGGIADAHRDNEKQFVARRCLRGGRLTQVHCVWALGFFIG